MRDEQFRKFLENDPSITSKQKAVNSRLAKARKVEEIFKVNLDDIVRDDEKTYKLLMSIKPIDRMGNYQNAVRKYYIFVNGIEFPSIAQYEYNRNKSKQL